MALKETSNEASYLGQRGVTCYEGKNPYLVMQLFEVIKRFEMIEGKDGA